VTVSAEGERLEVGALRGLGYRWQWRLREAGMEKQMIGVSLLIIFGTVAAEARIVALDGFHNDETAQPDHYQWEGTRPGGFSELGKLIAEAGDRTRTIRQRIKEDTLRGIDLLIIIDPDTPQESEHPRYIEPGEADVIEKWVRAGGRLMLLGNDKGNAEFEQFNQFAKRLPLPSARRPIRKSPERHSPGARSGFDLRGWKHRVSCGDCSSRSGGSQECAAGRQGKVDHGSGGRG
jgi:hypothetical protein